MKIFCETYKLRNLLQERTCFIKPDNPTCIDLVLTNKPLSFKNTVVIEAGLTDFHKMLVGVMKIYFPKMKLQIIRYRKYKGFHSETFLDSLNHHFNTQGRFLNEKGLNAFSTVCTDIFDKHPPKKAFVLLLLLLLLLLLILLLTLFTVEKNSSYYPKNN